MVDCKRMDLWKVEIKVHRSSLQESWWYVKSLYHILLALGNVLWSSCQDIELLILWQDGYNWSIYQASKLKLKRLTCKSSIWCRDLVTCWYTIRFMIVWLLLVKQMCFGNAVVLCRKHVGQECPLLVHEYLVISLQPWTRISSRWIPNDMVHGMYCSYIAPCNGDYKSSIHA